MRKTLTREGRTVLELRVGQRESKKRNKKHSSQRLFTLNDCYLWYATHKNRSIDVNMCFGRLPCSFDFYSGFYGSCLTMHILFRFSCDS